MTYPLRNILRCLAASLLLSATAASAEVTVDMTSYGIRPDTRRNMSPRLSKALADIKSKYAGKEAVTLKFAPGRYDFHPKGSHVRETTPSRWHSASRGPTA